MKVFIHNRPWDQGEFISDLFEKYLISIGCSIYHQKINSPQSVDTNIDYDFAFGWGCSSTLAYVRDVLSVPTFVFDLGMIKRTEFPKTHDGYFRFGLSSEKWINVGRKECSDRFNCLGIQFKSLSDKNGIISFMGQVPGDASHGMAEDELLKWTEEKIFNIKEKYTNIILYKPHPLTIYREKQKIFCDKLSNYGILVNSSDDRIENADMRGYRCCITYCSTSAVNFILNGIPVAASKKDSMYGDLVSDVCGDDIDIDYLPGENDKQEWFNSMSYSQWNKEEICNGIMWDEMKKFI